MADKYHLDLLIETIQGNDVQLNLEELVKNSIVGFEKYFDYISNEQKICIIKFTLSLFEIKSISKSFHESRMALLAVIIDKTEITDLFEYNIDDFDIVKHICHGVSIANLEIKLFLEANIIEFEDKNENLNNYLDYKDEDEFKIVSSSFRILDSLIAQLNKDENLIYLESSNKISANNIIELIDSLKDAAKHCIDYILDLEQSIKKELTGNLEKESSGNIKEIVTFDNNEIKNSKLYWTVNSCCSISSKWQIIEPGQDLHKFIKMLEIVSQYLNPLHFASTFPTMVHISVLDWANVPNILESLIISLLSFCTLIKEKETENSNKYNLHGLYSGLYYTSLLITSAWWSPGVDTYRTIISKSKNQSKSFEYFPRNYFNISCLNSNFSDDVNNQEANKKKEIIHINNSSEFIPLNTNTIPEYVSFDNPGIERIRKIATTIFSILVNMNSTEIDLIQLMSLEKMNFLNVFDQPESLGCEKLSAIIQTLVCILTLLTCRIQNSNVPEELWKIIFLVIIKLTPNSSKSYYFESSKKISIFISSLRSVAIAFSTGYSNSIVFFKEVIENLKIKSTYNIPKLRIKEFCQEFSKEDEETINFFRILLD